MLKLDNNWKKIKKEIINAVIKFNKYRAPEAKAKLLGLNKKYFTIKFYGPFCASCSVYDYFEDILYQMPEKFRSNFNIQEILEEKEGYIVKYLFSTHIKN